MNCRNTLKAENQRMTVYLDKKKKGLLDLLSKDLVFVENKKCRWEEALRKSAKPLEERGTINEQYIESIIDSLRYYGPYMFITKDVVLAHSQPKDNVNDLGVLRNRYSFLTSMKPRLSLLCLQKTRKNILEY